MLCNGLCLGGGEGPISVGRRQCCRSGCCVKATRNAAVPSATVEGGDWERELRESAVLTCMVVNMPTCVWLP